MVSGMGEYQLKCPYCSKTFPDNYINECPSKCGLVRADYGQKQLTVRKLPGIFRFHDWLPVKGYIESDAGPVTYKSLELAGELGLSELYICFNGYWPEKSAFIKTCSFKELEALPTSLRLKEHGGGVLQVSSAGNTGRAFAEVSAKSKIPVILSVPENGVKNIWTTEETEDVLMYSVSGDYTDAIEFGNSLCEIPGVIPEGGAKNPARRDGMGTTLLDGAVTMKRLPDWYFQAVGSGTGGIAAWEMSLRLIADDRFGNKLPRLHLCQNEPFIPMVDSWNKGLRGIVSDFSEKESRELALEVYAGVLTNRHPPYSVPGGLFDALTDTDGIMASVKTPDAKSAGRLFEDTEGIDLDPAAEVCVASLINAVDAGTVEDDDFILLNITGGGYRRLTEDYDMIPLSPSASLPAGSTNESVRTEIVEWLKNYERG
jgi:cysteate synthase